MARNSLIFLIIELLVINTQSRERKPTKSPSSYATLLAVTFTNVEDCHSCLLENVGVERIHLVGSNKDTRIYLIKSRLSIIESFLTQCNNGGRFCQLQTHVDKFPPCLWQSPVLEYAISLFSMHMDDTILDTLPNVNMGEGLSNLQSYRWIAPFLFLDDIKTMHSANNDKAETGKIELKRNQIDISSIFHAPQTSMGKNSIAPTPAHQYSPSVERCLYSYSRRFQCERCLALHSISLGVRVYSFITVKRGFEFVFAFSSYHPPSRIQENCAGKYCTSLRSLSSEACNNLDRIFPHDKNRLDDSGNSAKSLESEIEMATTNRFQGLVLSEADLYFRYLVSQPDTEGGSESESGNYERLAKLHEEVQIIEKFLDQPRLFCLRIRAVQQLRLRFLNCLVRSARDKKIAILVRSISPLKQVIFLDSPLVTANLGEYCKGKLPGSYIYIPPHPRFCKHYQTKYNIKPSVFPELSTLAKANRQTELCVLVLHHKSMDVCRKCVKDILKSMHKGWKLVQSTYLILSWGSIEHTTWTMVNTVLLSCAGKTRCSKIQLIPAFVCKKHEEIMRLYTNGQSDTDSLANCTVMNESVISKFDRESKKIWPPAHRTFSDASNLLDRTAFMVAFNANILKECVRCLILRTEVYFSYMSEGERLGYIWMRPNSARLLKPCVSENICTELWYVVNFEQLFISDDMRPWSVGDIGDTLPSKTNKPT